MKTVCCVESSNNNSTKPLTLSQVPSLTEELSEQELSSQLQDVDTRSGGWSSWSEWSSCSRSCDGGVSHQIRTCNAAPCRGEHIRHKICNMQVIIFGLSLVEGHSFFPSTNYGFPILDGESFSANSLPKYKSKNLGFSNPFLKHEDFSKTFFPIFEVETTTPPREVTVPHQIYGVPNSKPPTPHKEYGLPTKPHTQYGIPHERNNISKTFFPIFEIENTTPFKELVVPHQIYGIPSTKSPTPHGEYGLPYEKPLKPHSPYAAAHKESNPPKTFFPIVEIEGTTSPSQVVKPHQIYGLPIMKPPVPHKEYGLPNKPHTFVPIETTTPSKELIVPHEIHGIPSTKPPTPHTEYGLPNQKPLKPHSQYGAPHKPHNARVHVNEDQETSIPLEYTISKDGKIQIKRLYSKTFFPPLELEINTQDIIDLLVPEQELVVPQTEPPSPQSTPAVSQAKPPKPHEVYGIPTSKPHGVTDKEPQKPHQFYGVPGKKPPKRFEDYSFQIAGKIGQGYDSPPKKNQNKKIAVLKFKYVPYLEIVDPPALRSTHTASPELNLDYW